jgi:hypothetical protein
MTKSIFIVIASLVIVEQASAVDLQLGFAAGYGFASGRDEVSPSYVMNSDGEYIEYKNNLASYGNGIKFDVDLTIFLNNTLGIMVGTGFSMLGGYSYEREDPAGNSDGKFRSFYLPLTGGLKLQAGFNKISPYIFVAPGLFIPIGVNSVINTDNLLTGYTTTEYEYKFAPGFGISSGIGMLLGLTDGLKIRFEFAPTYAFARLTERKRIADDGTVTVIVYKKNKTDIPENSGNTSYTRGADMFSFSSIAAKFGIVLGF